MTKISDEIADLEKKMEQKRQRLRNLKAQETKQQKKDADRRVFIYGKAFLAAVDGPPDREKARLLRMVQNQIARQPERKFLGLPDREPLSQAHVSTPDKNEGLTGDLPFGGELI